MSSEVVIQKFSVIHANRVFELLQDVSDFSPDSNAQEIAHFFIKQEGSHSVVAIRDTLVIGFGSIFITQRVRGGRSATIEDMVVSVDYRGQGIGNLILNELIAYAKIMSCFKVSLESNKKAENFYQEAGFEYGGQSMKMYLTT